MWTWRKIGLASSATTIIVIFVAIGVDQGILPWIVSMTPTISVPSVVGMKAEQGRMAMEQAGLHVVQVREQHNDETPAGQIISQLPYSGAIVKEGRRAYLTISKGVERIRVPRLQGMTQRDARLALLRYGLLLGSVTYRSDSSVSAGTVISQSIAEGTPLHRESTIDIVVSNGGGLPVPDLVGLTLAEAQQILESNGLTMGATVQRTSSAFEAGTVIGQSPKPDSSVQASTPITLIIAK
jgi:serine/threonine-protein kinase